MLHVMGLVWGNKMLNLLQAVELHFVTLREIFWAVCSRVFRSSVHEAVDQLLDVIYTT